MPRCLHPDETFDVVLKSDESLPEKDRPYFTFRAFSIRQFRQAMLAMQKVQSLDEGKLENVEVALGAICDVLRLGMVGWGNMLDHNVEAGQEPIWIPYDPAQLDSILGMEEASELMEKMLGSAQLTVDDKKKLESPPSSAKNNSARRAPRAAARSRPAR